MDHFPNRHTGENISAKLDSLAANWGKKPFQITTDSGSNVKLGVRTHLEKEGTYITLLSLIDFLSHSISGISCKAHAIDNMLKDAFKIESIATLYEKQAVIVKFVRKSNKANNAFKTIQKEMHAADPDPINAHHRTIGWTKEYGKTTLALVMAGKTRWWSTLKQNKRFVRLKPALLQLFDILEEDPDVKPKVKVAIDLAPNDWKVMEYFVELLAPFKSAIKELEGPPPIPPLHSLMLFRREVPDALAGAQARLFPL